MIPGLASRRRFDDLTEQEILALAISSEEDDARIYRMYAKDLRDAYPASAAVFDGMAAEEDTHRHWLIERHKARFGEVIPLIRREHVAGFYARRPVWLVGNLGLDRMRGEAEAMEREAAAFYRRAAQNTQDAETRKLLGDLAAAEARHESKAGGLGHAMPYLIPDFWTATTIAIAVVFVELWAIVWIQNRFMETPFLRATFQVVLGGALVFAAGVLIGGG